MNATSLFSQESRLPQSPSSFFESNGNSVPMAVVAPSPNLKGSRLGETWRNHGKSFRANIVLADEETDGDKFALSDCCAIERYYRVADRYEFT